MAGGRFRKAKSLVGAALASVMLTGCGAIDGVELNGGIFDAMGISGDALRASRQEQKVAARPGIVMPPDTSRLPPPGSAPAAAAPQDASWPVGPEDRARIKQAALKRQHDEFCKKAEQRRALAGQDAEPETGPLGSCRPGLGEVLFGSSNRAQ